MLNKFDESIRSMVESGLCWFYESFIKYLTQLRAQKILQADDEHFRALSINDLKGPLVFCSAALIFAWLIFILEIWIKKFKLRFECIRSE